MILSELFRCPRTGQELLQDETSAYSADGTHRYEIGDGGRTTTEQKTHY